MYEKLNIWVTISPDISLRILFVRNTKQTGFALEYISFRSRRNEMEAKASIVKIYSGSKPAERVDIILMNYSNFLGIVDAHTEGLVHLISCEKSYNRKSKQGDLGIRVQVSGASNPTADMAIENVMLREDIRKCNFSTELLKDLDQNEEEKFRRDMLTLQMMREEYRVVEAQLKALKRDEAELLNQYLEGDKDIQDIAEDKGISYDAAKQKLSRVRKRL